jgi:DNA repair exonuclease SbcCD ATPase subunit
VPAERLSGGEMVVFAIAFRMAVNSMYARGLGALVLDEPTAGLDRDNIGCLETALEKMKTVAQARGLQVILVTHEPMLHSLFDHVIELPAQR